MKWDLLWVVWDLIGIYFLHIGKKMYSFLEMPAKIYIQSRPNLLEFSALKPKSYNQSIDNINLPNLHALFFIAFLSLNHVLGIRFITHEFANFCSKKFFITKLLFLLLHRGVQKWSFAKYCPHFSFITLLKP